MTQAADAVKTTSNLNVRIPSISHDMLKAIALKLNTSINTVVTAVLEYTLAPEHAQQFWTQGAARND